MDTSAIRYRVVDFLKQHPPFQAIDETDLLSLAAQGRVRFYEAGQFILWQGEPHKLHVFVIQQGTVSLSDETQGNEVLRDVRGPGDMLGIERFTGARHCLYSARALSDVVLYGFPESEFDELVLKHPSARRFVDAYDSVSADLEWTRETRAPHEVFLHDVVGERPLERCDAQTTIREAAALLLGSGSDAIAVVDDGQRSVGVVTVDAVLGWVAGGAGQASLPIASLVQHSTPVVGPEATVTAGVLAMGEAGSDVLAVTADGSPSGRLHSLVTVRDIGRAFADQPASILREIRRAPDLQALQQLNHRARALTLRYLTSASAVDWASRFASLADISIVQRIIALVGQGAPPACWCFCGASGRGESLTRHAPQLVLIAESEQGGEELRACYERVTAALTTCDYLDRGDVAFAPGFLVAPTAEWQARYAGWLQDPVRNQMYLARPLFDLKPIHGRESLWREAAQALEGAVQPDFIQVLANDCLASLPPLTFFQDAVVDESGEKTGVFRLEHSALRPLVDVGRVFGLAARSVLGTSTLDRFARARTLLPEHESIFRDAAQTLRILLWQQARIGIAQGTSAAELPPALLSRHDRHVLKSGFRSILRLIEFTGNTPWFANL
ncbi:MAG: putative nucleotidyltransferase substrate binding domain-containing protein [Vicinamibacterales bacterium]